MAGLVTMKTNSCYDWRVDSPLLSKELAEDSDITGSVDVAVERKPAVIAAIPYSLSVGFSDYATGTALLACVPGIDIFNNLPKSFSFVFQEIPELSETPITKHLVESLPVFLPSPDVQSLQNKEIGITFGNLLTDTVVDITHEPSLSSTETFKMSLGGSSAFTLQACLQPLIFSFDCSNVTAIKEFIIAGNDWIDNASIDSNNLCEFDFGGSIGLDNEIKISHATFDVESRTVYLPVNISFETLRDDNTDLNSTKCCRQRYNSTTQEGFECVVIKPDCGKFLFLGQSFQFLPLKHLAGLIPGRTYEATIELRELLPDVSVSGFVEFGFIVSPHTKPFFDTNIAYHIEEPYGIFNAVIQRNLKFYNSLHDKPLDLLFKYQNPLYTTGGEKANSPTA